VLLTSAVAIAVGIYAVAEPSGRAGKANRPPPSAFWPLWLFLWAALNALFLSRDVFNVYVALELATLAAVALVALGETREAVDAAVRYLLAALVGSLAYLLAVALLYGAAGTLSFDALAAGLERGLPASLALALATVGLALKAALFPLHFWLPAAHGNAPAVVSAVLSALVVKASFFVLLRLWLEVFPGVATRPAASLLGALGTAAVAWGSVQALRQRRLKMLVAYSTVAQLGYLFLLFPLLVGVAAGPAREEALAGGVYHALSHGFAKAAMFLAAGNVLRALGTDEIRHLGGIARRLPLSTYAFGIGGISLVGVPPSGGFVAKWLLLRSAIDTGQWWVAAAVLGGGFLAAGYLFVVLRYAFLPVREPVAPAGLPRALELAPFGLALVSLVLGLRAHEPLELLRRGAAALLGGGGG
jgi:multicomponent Na+:H+ antiporter subunit D